MRTEYAVAFLSGALLQLMVVWYTREDNISKEELASTLTDALSKTYISIPSA